MGFRAFEMFNQAMLAKQGSRLIAMPESLCSRILKGKYFHDNDFMSAKNKREVITYLEGHIYYMAKRD